MISCILALVASDMVEGASIKSSSYKCHTFFAASHDKDSEVFTSLKDVICIMKHMRRLVITFEETIRQLLYIILIHVVGATNEPFCQWSFACLSTTLFVEVPPLPCEVSIRVTSEASLMVIPTLSITST
jgi:hypothetical protein